MTKPGSRGGLARGAVGATPEPWGAWCDRSPSFPAFLNILTIVILGSLPVKGIWVTLGHSWLCTSPAFRPAVPPHW